MSNLEDSIRFALLLAKYAPKRVPAAMVAEHGKGEWPAHWTSRDALAIMRDARSLSRLAETACNRELTVAETARDLMLERRIAATLKPYRATLDTSGDPRGFVVRIHFPGGESNNLGNGWGL